MRDSITTFSKALAILFFLCLNFVNSVGEKCYLMVLISVPLIIRENEHVFLVFVHQLCVFPLWRIVSLCPLLTCLLGS